MNNQLFGGSRDFSGLVNAKTERANHRKIGLTDFWCHVTRELAESRPSCSRNRVFLAWHYATRSLEVPVSGATLSLGAVQLRMPALFLNNKCRIESTGSQVPGSLADAEMRNAEIPS